MKNWPLLIGLALPPLCYVGLMLATHELIDWIVLVLTLVIVVPIFVFRTRINKVEKEFNAMSGKEQAQAAAKAAGTWPRSRRDRTCIAEAHGPKVAIARSQSAAMMSMRGSE